jgi:hypothetical protein
MREAPACHTHSETPFGPQQRRFDSSNAKRSQAVANGQHKRGFREHTCSAPGGLPVAWAVALAATFDGAGWSETACMLAAEMAPPGAKPVERTRTAGWVASLAHDAARWAEQSWRMTEGPRMRLPSN